VPRLSFDRIAEFKSRLRVLAAVFLESRDKHARHRKALRKQVQSRDRMLEKKDQQIARLRAEVAALKLSLEAAEKVNSETQEYANRLPQEEVLPHHGFGPNFIAMCMNLALSVGLRASSKAMDIIFKFLKIDSKIPHWTSIRLWIVRSGVASIAENRQSHSDWVWMADHSCQIGQEKVLLIPGMRLSEMPPVGTPLTQQNMRVLLVEPGTKWTREEVAQSYLKLAATMGAPAVLISDGAVELQESAEQLKTLNKDIIVLRDIKHLAANILEKTVGADEHYREFASKVSQTRCAIQQTELGHLTPPPGKSKARFMNLAPVLKWATRTLWLHDHQAAKGREGIAVERFEHKLGWLGNFREDTIRWGQCQDVMSAALTFMNERGVYSGVANQLSEHLRPLQTCQLAKQMADRLEAHVRVSEAKLPAGLRVPLSTEVAESTFGLFKQLEGQHSKGGFTRLLPAIATLSKGATGESVRRHFAQVSVQQTKDWLAANLPQTLASRRKAAYAEAANAIATEAQQNQTQLN
jgi:hypothetical protein